MSNSIKPNLKTEIFPVALVAITFAAAFYFYAHFPARVPTHWDFSGQVNGWSSAVSAAFSIPIMLAVFYLFFLALPLLDPKKERYAEFRRAYHIFKGAIIFFLSFIYFLASLNGLGYDVPIGFYTPIMVGVLFMIMGNYMGKFKSNWFIGVRTPWTLSSEEVWNKTNRLAGKMFIFGGIAMIAEAFLPLFLKLPVFIVIIVSVAAVPIVYSYLLFRKKTDQNNNP